MRREAKLTDIDVLTAASVSLHVSACACQTGGATGEARLTMCLKIVDASIAEESEVFAS